MGLIHIKACLALSMEVTPDITYVYCSVAWYMMTLYCAQVTSADFDFNFMRFQRYNQIFQVCYICSKFDSSETAQTVTKHVELNPDFIFEHSCLGFCVGL